MVAIQTTTDFQSRPSLEFVEIGGRCCGCDGSVSALRNRRVAAAASRRPESMKSIVAPVESMAR